MKKSQSVFSSVSAAVGRLATAEPTINILSFALAGHGMARIVADVTHTGDSREDHNLVAQAIRSKLDNRMQAVAGSFEALEQAAYSDKITGLVSVVRDIMPVEGDMRGFRATAANMFMDDEKDMWVLRKTEAGQILVKATGVDDDNAITGLLESVSSTSFRNDTNNLRFVAQASAIGQDVQGGDFVSYVNFGSLSHGFVVATASDNTAFVLANGADDIEQIQIGAITKIHDQTNFPEFEQNVDTALAASRETVNLTFLTNYYKRVFARSQKYFDMFVERLKGHSYY